jgi:triacylglycerol esterase/lipase EstA (alpha/beta hydrolase family)
LTATAAGGVLRAVSIVPHLVIILVTTVLLVGVALPVTLEVQAARARRRADTCAFEEDEPLHWQPRLHGRVVEARLTALALLVAPLTLGRRAFGGLRDATDRPPLVLVLGWGQHPLLWRPLVRRLRADGWGRLAVVGWTTPRLSLEAGADALADAVAQLRVTTGAARIDVVAHGAGGLVVRAYLRARASDAGIGRVLTLGAPHQGTEAATWRGLRALVGALAPEGAPMAALGANDPVPARVDFVALYSHEDALVLPPGHAYYPGAFGIEVRGPGHLGLLRSWHVYELIRENLAAETAPVRAASASGQLADG